MFYLKHWYQRTGCCMHGGGQTDNGKSLLGSFMLLLVYLRSWGLVHYVLWSKYSYSIAFRLKLLVLTWQHTTEDKRWGIKVSEVDKSCFPLHIVNVERGSFTLMKNGRAGGAGRGGGSCRRCFHAPLGPGWRHFICKTKWRLVGQWFALQAACHCPVFAAWLCSAVTLPYY